MSSTDSAASDPAELGPTLLQLARLAIGAELGVACPLPRRQQEHTWLEQPGACYVTLTKGGHLRGSIGSLEAYRSLADDVYANAQAAAFLDRRYKPLTQDEFGYIDIEVALLTPATPLEFDSEAHALAQLRPGRDGVILVLGSKRVTFLPQVWQDLPEPADFMAALKRKAGLNANAWDNALRLSRYQTRQWQE